MFYAIAALAYNLLVTVELPCPPQECGNWQLQTMLRQIIRLPATEAALSLGVLAHNLVVLLERKLGLLEGVLITLPRVMSMKLWKQIGDKPSSQHAGVAGCSRTAARTSWWPA